MEKETQNGDTKKALDENQEQINDRSNGSMGILQPAIETEGSSVPVSLDNDTFEQTVTSHPTFSYPLLHFSTRGVFVSRKIPNHNLAHDKELKKVNRYAASLQQVAKWYKENLSDTKLTYLYKDGVDVGKLSIIFHQENFIHLAGIRPIQSEKTAKDFVDDFIAGRGEYDNILLNFSVIEKLQVLPMLPEIIESTAFVLDDISMVEKFKRLDLSKAVKSKDEDFLLLFKNSEENIVPASLMKIKGNLIDNIASVPEKEILGVYRERNGVLEQLSINEVYIKDGGKEMMSILENRDITLEPLD